MVSTGWTIFNLSHLGLEHVHGRTSHEMINVASPFFVCKVTGSIGYETLTLCGPNGRTQVGFGTRDAKCLTVLRRVTGNHMISSNHRGDAISHSFHNTTCLVMPQNTQRESFVGITSIEHIHIHVTRKSIGQHLDANFTSLFGTPTVMVSKVKVFLGA
eukprot:scaffold82233_cov48-Attheya_sp.AAC.1